MISNCGHNENNGISGGVAGDQTGTEYQVCAWYSRPWKCVLRYPTLSSAVVIAQCARDAANNENIGYDQPRRLTFYKQLATSAVNWYPSNITTACDADCSSSTCACIIAAGHQLGDSTLSGTPNYLTTQSIRSTLVSRGWTLLTASKYLSSDAYLLPGDVLLNDGAHAAINLDAGSSSGSDIVVSDGSTITANVGGGNLYDTENDEDDAILREVAYLNGYTPTVNKTNIRLSVINYTSALQAIFYGKVGYGSGVSVDASALTGNYRIILEYCMSKGMNAAGGCGVCANIQQESSGNPNAVSTDGNSSIGICQWTGDRKTALINYLNGNWQNNLTGQLDYLWVELTGSYKSNVLDPILAVPNTEAGAREAAYIFVSEFERPSRYWGGVDTYAVRQEYASQFWNQLVLQQSV